MAAFCAGCDGLKIIMKKAFQAGELATADLLQGLSGFFKVLPAELEIERFVGLGGFVFFGASLRLELKFEIERREDSDFFAVAFGQGGSAGKEKWHVHAKLDGKILEIACAEV